MNFPDRKSENIRETFGENLRLLSKPFPSVAEMCRQMDINRSQFNRYLNGEAFPRPDTLIKICEFFEVSPLIFVYRLDEFDATPVNVRSAPSYQLQAAS